MLFKSKYQEFLMDGKEQFEAASYRNMSFTIKIPVDLYDPVEKRQLAAYIETRIIK
jgi:hypothetical protein